MGIDILVCKRCRGEITMLDAWLHAYLCKPCREEIKRSKS